MDLNCSKCNSERIIAVIGKTSDSFNCVYKTIEFNGYVPEDMNIGGGDYLKFSYCLDCGQIQGHFPIKDKTIELQMNLAEK